MAPISVAVRRGDVVESRHRVHAVAVRRGDIVDAAGDPGLVTFLRSAAKPFQALPLALEHPDLPSEEVAIACASHEARSEQLVAVRSLLRRARATEDDLECGRRDGSKLRHNCSGKHAGMLLRAESHGWSRSGYRLGDHPLQRDLAALVAGAARLALKVEDGGSRATGPAAAEFLGFPPLRVSPLANSRGEHVGSVLPDV